MISRLTLVVYVDNLLIAEKHKVNIVYVKQLLKA